MIETNGSHSNRFAFEKIKSICLGQMLNFIGVFHESSVRASSFIWRVILSFLKLLVTSILSPPNGKFYQSKHLTKVCLAFS